MVKVKFYVDNDTVPKSQETAHRVYFHHVYPETPVRGSLASLVLLKNQLLEEELAAIEVRATKAKDVRSSEEYKKLRYQMFDENKAKNKGKIICSYCGRECNREHEHPHQATLDHIVPLSEGGDALDRNNLVVACRKCNKSKRSQTVDQFKKKVRARSGTK